MDKRTLLITAALAAPLVVMLLLAQSPSDVAQKSPADNSKQQTAAPSPEKPNAQRRQAGKNAHPQGGGNTLQAARERTRQRLAELEKMTEEEFKEDQKKRREAWNNLPTEQKARALGLHKPAEQARPQAQRQPAMPQDADDDTEN